MGICLHDGSQELRTMARVAKITKTTKSAVRGRKPGRPTPVAAKTPAKVTKPTVAPKRAAIVAPTPRGRKPGRPAAVVPARAAVKVTKVAAPKRATVAAAPALKLSKDELRVQVETLERANATLRAKNREVNRTAKAATARIAELEENVARLTKKAALQTPPRANGEQAAKPSRAKRQSRGVDRDNALPAVVADQEPAPLDEDGEAALENREEQLGHS
jgi:hypothetical protein